MEEPVNGRIGKRNSVVVRGEMREGRKDRKGERVSNESEEREEMKR